RFWGPGWVVGGVVPAARGGAGIFAIGPGLGAPPSPWDIGSSVRAGVSVANDRLPREFRSTAESVHQTSANAHTIHRARRRALPDRGGALPVTRRASPHERLGAPGARPA